MEANLSLHLTPRGVRPMVSDELVVGWNKMDMIRSNLNLNEEPRPIPGLRYDELVEMIRVISDPDSDEELQAYYIRVIDITLPGANVSDLIFWPNSWFNDEAMLSIELSEIEIANYILAWTKRRLPGSEDIELPDIPSSKLGGPPNIIEL